MYSQKKFIELKNFERVWAIGSIHGNINGIKNMHSHIQKNFHKDDKVVYLGNVIGVGEDSSKVLSEILEFRLKLMADFELNPDDIIYLRGAQEEMWSKLLELHTSPNPNEVLIWMFEHGVNKTLLSYDINPNEIIDISNSGTILISKWIAKLKSKINSFNGHNEYYSNLLHAAFSNSKKILFVNRGVDLSRPLSAQNDCFWWGYQGLSKVNKPYYSFIRIVRGYDPKKIGPKNDTLVCSLYKGSGFGESIVGGLFSSEGKIIDLFEA